MFYAREVDNTKLNLLQPGEPAGFSKYLGNGKISLKCLKIR